MKNEGIFAKAWLPGAMNVPYSSTKVKRITGGPPGYAGGRAAAAAAGFGRFARPMQRVQMGGGFLDPDTSPCADGEFLAVPMSMEEPYCASECPEGWTRVVDESGSKYICTETPFSMPGMEPPPIDPASQNIPSTTPIPSTTELPVPVPSTPSPTTTPTPVTAPPPAPGPAPSQAAQPAPVPTWVYVGGAAAVLLVVGAIALR